MKFDSAVAMTAINSKKNENTLFATASEAYNKLREAYDKKITEETARRNDLFKAIFESEYDIPERPCPPNRPSAFNVWDINLKKITETGGTWPTKYTDAKNLVYISNTIDSTPTYNAREGFRHGFLQVAPDASKTTLNVVARVMGILGQGDLNSPAKSKPFQWRTASTTTTNNKAGMMFSVYPEKDESEGNKEDTMTVEFEANGLEWSDFSEWNVPAQPDQPKDPLAALGAKTLVSGVLAVGVVIASLY